MNAEVPPVVEFALLVLLPGRESEFAAASALPTHVLVATKENLALGLRCAWH